MHILNQTAAVILHYCDGNTKTRDVVERIRDDLQGEEFADFFKQLNATLENLVANGVVRFSAFTSESVPVLGVRFRNFWPEFDPEYNYFTLLMKLEMLVIIVETGTPDVLFESRHVDKTDRDDADEYQKGDCIRVFVPDSRDLKGFDGHDYVFLQNHAKGTEEFGHSRISRFSYNHEGPFKIDRKAADKFYNFLFPLDPQKLRFQFSGLANKRLASKKMLNSRTASKYKIAISNEKSKSTLHILFSVDFAQHEGLFALVNSILKNSSSPERLFFHVLVDKNVEFYETVFNTRFDHSLRYEVVSFEDTVNYQKNVEFLSRYVKVRGSTNTVDRIRNVMNFARFYLPEIFVDIDVGLFLDVDMIVQSDLLRLSTINMSNTIVASPLNRTFWNLQ